MYAGQTMYILAYLHLSQLVKCGCMFLLKSLMADLDADQLSLDLHPSVIHLPKERVATLLVPLPHCLQLQGL